MAGCILAAGRLTNGRKREGKNGWMPKLTWKGVGAVKCLVKKKSLSGSVNFNLFSANKPELLLISVAYMYEGMHLSLQRSSSGV